MIHQGVKILLTDGGYKADGFPYTIDNLEKLKRELDWIAAGKSNAWVITGGRVSMKPIDEIPMDTKIAIARGRRRVVNG